MLTSRERWLALLTHQKPDRVPTDYGATPEVTKALLEALKCPDLESLYIALHIDAVDPVWAPRIGGDRPVDPDTDIWGIRYRKVTYGGGQGYYNEAIAAPLAGITTVEQVHEHPWPSADDHDYDAFAHQLKQLRGHRPVRAGGYEPFLIYCRLRGMEQAYMDLLVEPEVADAILEHIFDYHYRLNERMFEIGHGKIDITGVAEDLGGQTSLLMGLDQIRRFLLPRQKKMADLARSHGIHIAYHTDGAAREAIPDLINVTGIELLNPIQWRCPGMEREGLVRDFGDRIVFHGAMDNQHTLPFGSPQDVRDEVLDNIRLFAPARWICAPCHNIQPVTPIANILAMYETIWQHGKL
jgi:uroporphyrinogen decarboxylase